MPLYSVCTTKAKTSKTVKTSRWMEEGRELKYRKPRGPDAKPAHEAQNTSVLVYASTTTHIITHTIHKNTKEDISILGCSGK